MTKGMLQSEQTHNRYRLWEDVVLDLTVFLFWGFGVIWLVIQDDIGCFLLVQYFLRSFKPTCNLL